MYFFNVFYCWRELVIRTIDIYRFAALALAAKPCFPDGNATAIVPSLRTIHFSAAKDKRDRC